MVRATAQVHLASTNAAEALTALSAARGGCYDELIVEFESETGTKAILDAMGAMYGVLAADDPRCDMVAKLAGPSTSGAK
jgi:hypothetical protein